MKPTIGAIAMALALASAATFAQGAGYGYGHGPGMMGGGYGPGYGRSGGGFGGPFAALHLTDEQQEKIFAIQEDHRRKNWDTMSKLRSEMFKLRRLYNAESVDSKAVLEQQTKVDEQRRQMLASHLDMRKQMESVLTAEQRKQARQFGPWWLDDE